MQELRFVGVHEDGSHVLLADESGGRYRLAIDDGLRAAARRAGAASAGPTEPALTARDVQTLIRAGHSTDEVAERAGWPVRKVAVFEAPILAERGYVAGLAMNTRLRSRVDSGEGELLSARVERRLAGRGVSGEQAEWDATRPETGRWQVHVVFPAGGRERQASWRFEHASGMLEALDDEARWLSEEDSAAGSASAPRLGGEVVYDVDAAGGLGADESLMTAIREHSHAGERRGRARRVRPRSRGEDRPSELPQNTAGRAAGDGRQLDNPATMVGAQELPIEDLAVETPADPVDPDEEPVQDALDNNEELVLVALQPTTDSAETDTADTDTADTDTAAMDSAHGDKPFTSPVDSAAADSESVDDRNREEDSSAPLPAPPEAEATPRKRTTRRRGRVGVPDWNDVMFGPSRGADAP